VPKRYILQKDITVIFYVQVNSQGFNRMQTNKYDKRKINALSALLVCFTTCTVDIFITSNSFATNDINQPVGNEASKNKALRIASGACDFVTQPTIVMNYIIDNGTPQKAFTVKLRQCFSYNQSTKTVTLTAQPEHSLVSVEPSFQQYIGISDCTNVASLNSKATGDNSIVISRCSLNLQRSGGTGRTIKIQPAPQALVPIAGSASISIGTSVNTSYKANFTLKISGNASSRVEFTG
jgi:hypothetical protein